MVLLQSTGILYRRCKEKINHILKVISQIIYWVISNLPHTIQAIRYSFHVLTMKANKIIDNLSLWQRSGRKLRSGGGEIKYTFGNLD